MSANAPGQGQPGRYDKGPVSITWQPSGEQNTSCSVHVEFEGSLIAANTLSPGDTTWETGRRESDDGWCEAAFDLQVPTPGQEGQLNLVSLVWVEDAGGAEDKVDNQLLASWPLGQ